MAIVSSIFFVFALILGVTLGPQTRPWTWGPALFPLAISVLAALPVIWRSRRISDTALIVFGTVVAGWFAWRASISPVRELAVADLLLLAAAVGSFIVMRAISDCGSAQRIFLWGLALLLLASVIVVGMQVSDPAFNPIFASRPAPFPAGFFGHYNEGANFLIGASFLLGGAAALGKYGAATRVVWALIALGGTSAVWFTKSHGAILGVAVGLVVFAVVTLGCGKRRNARWFAPLLVALPIVGIAAGAIVFFGWMYFQKTRFGEGDISSVLDNSVRLWLFGIAFSCIQLHPLAGGGSRSFSWECYRFWGLLENGGAPARPEQVHNELLQAATDYGLVGGIGIAAFLLAVAVAALLRALFEETSARHPQADWVVVGGLAAISGMFVQSSFSFVFHLLPGAILLGICLGLVSIPSVPRKQSRLTTIAKFSIIAAALALTVFVMPFAWKGSRLMAVLWPTYFGRENNITPARRIDDLGRANRIWPQATLYKERAMTLHKSASTDLAKGLVPENAEAAISDYRAGLALHPYDAALSVNLANMLSLADRDDEALREYERAIRLQGGMEIGFRAHFHATRHLLKVGRKQLAAGETDNAIATFTIAVAEFDEAARGYPSLPMVGEGMALRNLTHEGLALAREQAGDLEGAIELYRQISTFREGGRGNYRAGVLLGKMAKAAWSERRPSEALRKFQEARVRVAAAAELPDEVTPDEKAKYLTYLDETIQFLIGAKIEAR